MVITYEQFRSALTSEPDRDELHIELTDVQAHALFISDAGSLSYFRSWEASEIAAENRNVLPAAIGGATTSVIGALGALVTFVTDSGRTELGVFSQMVVPVTFLLAGLIFSHATRSENIRRPNRWVRPLTRTGILTGWAGAVALGAHALLRFL